MRPSLTAEMANMVVEERVAAAERHRQQREARLAASEPDRYDAVTVRFATEKDALAMGRLAERDGSPEPRAPVLVAEAEGRLLAARSLADGRSVTDPFRHTAHLKELLALRSVHLQSDGFHPKRRGIRARLSLARRLVHS
jgi:hypothetical protein